MADVTVVTGAAGALGSEVARVLSARGQKLALVDAERGRERLAELAAALGGACVVAGDIAVEATWAEAMPRIAKELGAAPSRAALIAGGWRGGKPLHEEADDGVWDAMMGANLDTVHRSL
ncbi:MAG: SDR family NAD(P)-dependent oxidoreductase, partial [Polyangiaceae bacterium]